jgi:sugar lactone lactonase YvrE
MKKTWVATLAIAALALLAVPAASPGQPVVVMDGGAGELPEGITVDLTGHLWVSVQPRCEVRRYTRWGKETLRLQLVTAAEGCLAGNGLAIDLLGTVYAAVFSWNDATRGVYAIDWRGRARRIPGTEQIAYPNAIAVHHRTGALYVSDMTAGRIWKIDRRRHVSLWAEGPALTGNLPLPPGFPQGNPLGANGITIHGGAIYVAVTFAPRIVRIPINDDGTAGTQEVVVAPPTFIGAGVFSLDGLVRDVKGNLYAASPSALAVVKVPADGTPVSIVAGPADGITSSPLSLDFGFPTRAGQSLYVTINDSFGGTGAGVVKVTVPVPGCLPR